MQMASGKQLFRKIFIDAAPVLTAAAVPHGENGRLSCPWRAMRRWWGYRDRLWCERV